MLWPFYFFVYASIFRLYLGENISMKHALASVVYNTKLSLDRLVCHPISQCSNIMMKQSSLCLIYYV